MLCSLSPQKSAYPSFRLLKILEFIRSHNAQWWAIYTAGTQQMLVTGKRDDCCLSTLYLDLKVVTEIRSSRWEFYRRWLFAVGKTEETWVEVWTSASHSEWCNELLCRWSKEYNSLGRIFLMGVCYFLIQHILCLSYRMDIHSLIYKIL